MSEKEIHYIENKDVNYRYDNVNQEMFSKYLVAPLHIVNKNYKEQNRLLGDMAKVRKGMDTGIMKDFCDIGTYLEVKLVLD